MGFLAAAAVTAAVSWGQAVQFASPGQRLPGDRLKWDAGFQLVDMNGDGLLDIFMPVGGFEGTSMHLNIGTRENPRFDFDGMMGVNLTEATAGSTAWQTLEHTQAQAIGDLDGDGKMDMLAYDGRMRFLFGQGVNNYSVGWWDQPCVEGERFDGHDGTRSFPSSAQTRRELERFVTGLESMLWSKGIFARRVLTLGIEDWDRDGRNDMLVNLFNEEAPGVQRMVAVENEYWSAWGRCGIYARDWSNPTNATYHGTLSFKPARRTFWYRNVGPDRAYFADKQEFLSAGRPVDAPNPVLFDFTGNGFQDLFGTEVAYTGNAYRVDWPTSAFIEYYPASSTDPASLGAKTTLRDAQGNPIPAGVQLRFADYRGVGVKDLFVMDVGGTLRWYRNTARLGQAAAFQSPPQIISGTDFLRFMSDYQPLVVNWFGPDSRDLIVHGVIDTHCKYGLRRTALYRNSGGPGRVKYAFEGWLNVNGDLALVPQDWPHQDMAQDAFASMIGVMPVDTWTNPRLVVSVSGRLTLISGLQADKLTFTTRTPLDIPNPGRNRHTGGWQTVPVNQSARYVRIGNNDIINGESMVYPMGHERDSYLCVRRLEVLSGGVNVATPERGVTVAKTDGTAFRSDLYPANMLNPGENLESGTLPAFSTLGGYQGPAVVDLKAELDLGEIRILLSANQWRSYGYNLPGGTWLPYFWQNQAFSHGVDKGKAWYNYKVEVSSDNQTWKTVADRMDTEMAYSFPYMMDWNGDGKVDLLLGVVNARVTRPVTNEIRLYLNQGSNKAPLYTSHSVLLTRPAHPDKPGQQCSFQVLQEDGQKKLVVYDNSRTGAGAGGTRKEIFTLQGGVYQTTGTFLGSPYPINFRTSGWQYTHFTLADADGDGIPDLLDNSARNGIVFFKGTRATAPAGIATLRRIGGTSTSATLRWSVPAGATAYEVRWVAGVPIHDVNWGDANVVGGAYGDAAEQDAVVSGLPVGQRISFAVKSRNANNAWSPIGNVIDTVTGPQERRVFRNGAAGSDGEVAYASVDAVAIYGQNGMQDTVGSRDLWLGSGPVPGVQPSLVLVKFTDLPQMTGTLSRARLQLCSKPTEAIWNNPFSARMPVPPPMETHNITVYAFDHDWDPAVVSFNTRKLGQGWSQSLLTGGTFLSHHTPYWSVWTNTTLEWDVTEALRNVVQKPNGTVGFLVRIDYYGIYSANQTLGFLGVNSEVGRPQLVLEFGEHLEQQPK